MKKNLFKLAIFTTMLTAVVSCSKQDELLVTDDSQQTTDEGIVRASAAQIDYIANDVDWTIHTKNLLTCDKYGNAYYVSRVDYSPSSVMKINGSSLEVSTMLSESEFLDQGTSDGIGIAVDGNGDLFISTLYGTVRKYNTSGTSANVNFTPALLSKSLLGSPLFMGITVDMNDNIYVYNSANNGYPNQNELFRITKTGGVQLLSSNESLYMKYGGLFKGKGVNLFGVAYIEINDGTYIHLYSNGTATVEKVSPVEFQGMGAGMDNGFLYLLSGYTIQRVNPTNYAIRQMAELPQQWEIDGQTVKFGLPTRIAPTPDATAFYVAYDSGHLIKVTL